MTGLPEEKRAGFFLSCKFRFGRISDDGQIIHRLRRQNFTG